MRMRDGLYGSAALADFSPTHTLILRCAAQPRLEGALQMPPRPLEGSFEAADAAPRDEVEKGGAMDPPGSNMSIRARRASAHRAAPAQPAQV